MANVKKDDFIELEYTGKVKGEDFVFDTTNESTAKESGLDGEGAKFGPMIICVGENQVLKGLDNVLPGKEIGKDYSVDITAEDAFGKKNTKYVQLINTSKFKKQGIQPMPGLQVNIDNMVGIVKTVTGGRTMVDFNHPLSSKDLTYDFCINKIITDDTIKAKSFLGIMFGEQNVDIELKEGILKVKTKIKLPDEVGQKVKDKLKKVIPNIKKVVFTSPA